MARTTQQSRVNVTWARGCAGLLGAWVCGCHLVLGMEDFTAQGGATSTDASVGSPDDSPVPVTPKCTGGTVAATSSRRGRAMVHLGLLDGTCFWIDQTEVTRADYRAFLGSATKVWPTTCDPPASYETVACEEDAKSSTPHITTQDNHPVVCVSWCAASAYCVWAGKELCRGNLEGDTNQWNNAAYSSYYSACSSENKSAFPAVAGSGNPETCNGINNPVSGCNDTGSCTTQAVGTTACKTPEGVWDLGGNVSEWTNECRGTGPGNPCLARGGSMASGDLGCQSGFVEYPKTTARAYLGFRCCAYD